MLGPPIPEHIKEIRLNRGVYTKEKIGVHKAKVNSDAESSSEDEFGPPIPIDEDVDVAEQQAIQRLNERGQSDISAANKSVAEEGSRSQWLNAALGIKEEEPIKRQQSIDQRQQSESRKDSDYRDTIVSTASASSKLLDPKLAKILGPGIGSRFSKAES